MAGGDFPYEILSALPWERRDYVAQELRARPCLHRRRRCAPVLADRRARHAYGARRGGEPRAGSLRRCSRAGADRAVARLLRGGTAADRAAQCRNGDAELPRHHRHSRAGARKHVVATTRRTGARNMPKISPPEHVKTQYCYEHSPICVQDGTPPLELRMDHYVASTRPGTRAPHAWLADGRSTLDLYGDGLRAGAAWREARPTRRR